MTRRARPICRSRHNGQPLSVFDTERQALSTADHLRHDKGLDMLAYHCEMCGRWHLSPRHRHTPSMICSTCRSRNGQAKDLYASREAALRRANIIKREQGVALDVYRCPHHDGWHLTSR